MSEDKSHREILIERIAEMLRQWGVFNPHLKAEEIVAACEDEVDKSGVRMWW